MLRVTYLGKISDIIENYVIVLPGEHLYIVVHGSNTFNDQFNSLGNLVDLRFDSTFLDLSIMFATP